MDIALHYSQNTLLTWDGQSIYLNPVFPAIIQEFCFKKGREPDALNFMEDFEDFPLPLYAMTVTVVRSLLMYMVYLYCRFH